MLKIKLESFDVWDEVKMEFVTFDETVVCLEHSLVSISKWESYWKIPFLDGKQKTEEQINSYFSFMVTNHDPDDIFFLSRLSAKDALRIKEYIEDPMTASWVSSKNDSSDGSVTTSELIYFWMVSANIPFETQHWHLNRLLMLLKIYGEKNKPTKKTDRVKMMERNRILNEERRRKLGTNG